MISRRDFTKGLLVGASGVLGLNLGMNALEGEYDRFFSIRDGLGVKRLPKHHAEMKVILLGTGIPTSGIERSKPANVVMAGDRFFLVDCGAGVVQRLFMAGLPPSRISGLLFTHHHADHTSGFHDLLTTRWIGKAEPGQCTPLEVYGPTNTKEQIGKQMVSLDWDLNIRIENANACPSGVQLLYHEKNDGLIYQKDGIQITAFSVDHGIVKPAIGYRFEYKNKVIVISGDTLPTENMIRFSEGADILVHEAYSKDWMEKAKVANPRQETIINRVMGYHTSTSEAAEIAQKAGVKHLVYTHLIPDPTPIWYFERMWANGASDCYDGKITVGRDLMMF